MREILFRGQDIKSKWHTGLLAHIGNAWYVSNKVGVPTAIEVIPRTIGQYTGLTDKNGTNIFEGDIVHFNYIGENRGVEGTATVIFQNGQFGVLWGWHKEFVPLTGFCNTTVEVSGNIHDNPELLRSDTE